MADTAERTEKSGAVSVPPAVVVDAIEPVPADHASPPEAPSPNHQEQTAAEIKARPEREPKPADYFRVFGYAKPFDVACFIAAGLASSGAGIVSETACHSDVFFMLMLLLILIATNHHDAVIDAPADERRVR